ncbi:MAG: sigma-70 family RNA polymerase sigma factor [Planctomycetota bacterium]|jgi:RNA polymerase sigma factor (TIGR02999 family)
MSDVTRILNAIEGGDAEAADRLFPVVYNELRQLAARKMSREAPGQTLQATALVHEVYLRLVGADGQKWSSRTHFFATAAEAMRRILVENMRRKHSLKRGGKRRKTELDEAILTFDGPSEDIIALDEALTRLGEHEPATVELVKLRYFAGLTLGQAAELLGMSRRTATRNWTFARAWLYKQIAEDDTHD